MNVNAILIACVLFSCLSLVLSITAAVWARKERDAVGWFRRMRDAYQDQYDQWNKLLPRMEQKLDELQDQWTAFTKFRARVNMRWGREDKRRVEENPSANGSAPLTEAEKDEIRKRMHGSRFGIPRNMVED